MIEKIYEVHKIEQIQSKLCYKKVDPIWCLNEPLDFVEVKRSKLKNAGLGLIAIRDIKKNIAITWYKGYIVEKSTNPSYTWNYKSDRTNKKIKIEASMCNVANPLAFVNTFANEEQKALLNLDRVCLNDRLYYITTKDIKKGDELIVDYASKGFINRWINNKK
tara:strand:+ start:162 stop:650 length:489 start_codon:yes stop_codon:yes gene_type:complete